MSIKDDFISTPECYKPNPQSIDIGHVTDDRYYEHDYTSGMISVSQKSMVKEN